MAGKGKYGENRKAIMAGVSLASNHPLIAPLPEFEIAYDGVALELPAQSWVSLRVGPLEGVYRLWTVQQPQEAEPTLKVWPNLRRRASPEEWAYVFARLRLHAVLDHLDPEQTDLSWHMAAWCRAEELLVVAGVGRRPADFMPVPEGLPRGTDKALAQHLDEGPDRPDVASLSLGERGQRFWHFSEKFEISEKLRTQHARVLAQGIRRAASMAVEVAGGVRPALGSEAKSKSKVRQARDWIVSEYPLLAALASSFKLIEDEKLCDQMAVQVAAICDETQEIYVNPRVALSEEEARFVLAHEFLHSGLRHILRRQGRDPWLWNVACDFVINAWLLEMQVGAPPERVGYLYDADLAGCSAEEVYDRIVRDLRWMRKLRKARTLNGENCDMLEGQHKSGWWHGGGADLDSFYRRALSEGLELHYGRGRGLLPAGLIEEIRALHQPPIPWDVELAHWLDQFFPPLERHRSYARVHRRQSATPDIPRPAWITPQEKRSNRVFGAIIDTSGSMSRADLGKAVGAVASYAMSREVSFVRLIQCDATAHDSGYIEPESLLERVAIKGRGGTVLMPGVRYLEEATDFPKNGPILLITDGACDRLTIRREHAFLLAGGGRLPFAPRGPVFRFS